MFTASEFMNGKYKDIISSMCLWLQEDLCEAHSTKAVSLGSYRKELSLLFAISIFRLNERKAMHWGNL